MSTIQPIFKPFTTRPTTATIRNSNALHAVIRDQLALPTWLVIGAAIQGLAHLTLPYRNIVLVLPVFLFLFYKIANTALIMIGILPNPLMKDVVLHRTAIVYPNEKGLQENPGHRNICAILLGVVSHHPLGMFGPGFKEVSNRFQEMVVELSADASTHGFLGASDWINAGTRTSGNEFMSLLYFESDEALHRYAHGPMHSDTVLWWRENEDNLHQVGIMHEVFSAPKKNWEGVYVNYHPTGLGSTTQEVTNLDGKKEWVSPLVRANGKLAYSKGRMGRTYGDKEWEAFGATLDGNGM